MNTSEAAQTLLAVHAHYAQRGQSLAQAALAGAKQFVRWQHYPHDDVDDVANGSRFFYHAHEPHEMLQAEHGHFHVFTRWGSGQPLRYAHLIGIAIDHRGSPLRLFTTNQWVTGEDWRDAARLTPDLQRWGVHTAGRLAPVARWLTAMVRLYANRIASLLHERDAVLQAHAQRHQQNLSKARADRSLHIVSDMLLPNHWMFLQEECVR